MNTQGGINPIAPRRKNRKTKSITWKYELQCQENHLTDIGDMGLDGSLKTATMAETIQDSCDVGKCVAEHDHGSSTTLSNLNSNIQHLNNDEESVKSNDAPENDASGITSGITEKGGISKSDSLESLTKSRNVDSAKEESTCPSCVNVESVNDLSSTQTPPSDNSHAKEDENREESCGKADYTDDYPENPNPFEDSASDSDDGSETLNSSGCDNAELGPVRKTAKTRPSLYPWRPFAGETTQSKSHLIPARQTVKKWASLFPWRPFGEQDYPEELNPFNEIFQANNSDDHDYRNLTNAAEADSTPPDIEKSAGCHARSKGIQEEKPSQDTREEQRDIPSKTEDGDIDVEKPKKTRRGKRLFKTTRKKFRNFWNCVSRR